MHIPILRPDKSASHYNRKEHYSIIMEAMVDICGTFMDVYLGVPGKVHNARVFSNSSIFKKGSNGRLLHIRNIVVDCECFWQTEDALEVLIKETGLQASSRQHSGSLCNSTQHM